MARVLPCTGGDEERYVSEELLGAPLELVVDLPLAGESETEAMAEQPGEPRRKFKRLVLRADKEQSNAKKRATKAVEGAEHGFGKQLALVQTEVTKNVAKLKEELEMLETDRRRESAEIAQSLKRKDEQIEELGKSLKRKDEQIEELGKSLKRKDEQIEELGKSLKRTDEQIEELSKSLKRKDEQIEELGKSLKAQVDQMKASVKPPAEDESLMSKIAEMVAAAMKQSAAETGKGLESELLRKIEASEKSSKRAAADGLADLRLEMDLETAAYRLELCELKSSLSKFLAATQRLTGPR